MGLVKFTLAMTILTIIVALSMLIGIAVTYPSTTPEGEIGGAGEEITPPAIDIEISMAVIPDADGRVPEGGVSASDDKATVEIPAGVQLEEGAESLTFTATSMETTADISKTTPDELIYSVDLHVAGVAKDNTIPMSFTLKEFLPKGLNNNNVRLFHVENGETIEMTLTTTPAAHNEFSYDPLTGDAVITIASFSEVVVAADENAPWNGETFDYNWYKADGDLTIANAEQFAAFRNIVDGVEIDGVYTIDDFKDQKITLTANINLNGHNFDPIGWGYVNTGWNRDGVAGKVFKGTFDGNKNTIFGLYQSGWDLEDPNNDGVQDADYTYTNCGFGLFAAASGATFQNLTINGAYVRAECVEMGVLVGLSQNTCTYENIKIIDSKIANYQRPAGGLIGEVSGDGTTTITNVIIAEDVVVGSLWGDFDAPVGGVIGAYWNDVNADPQIYMTNLDVGCRLDVYNDITSAYQWHAYRRAGMLIGNTDMSDPNNAHKAYAPFLHCEDVRVYYGDWVNYHYCQFTNQDNTWANNYPWVRVEAGENCSAYSNPRYGQPVVDGVTVSTDDHTCTGEHHMVRQFSQLYGGGQGVYGQDKHHDDGVSYPENAYSITFVNDGKTLDVVYVPDNRNDVKVESDQAKKLVLEWAEQNMKEDYNSYVFGGWMTAASVKLDKITAGNTQNIVLYPYFTSPYTAIFVDENSNILDWCFFNEVNVDNLRDTFAAAKENLTDPGDDFELLHWRIRGTDIDGKTLSSTVDGKTVDYIVMNNNYDNWESFKGYKDVTITPHYRYKGADLIEVYNELTGEVDHYEVAGYAGGVGSTLVEIPDYVNGKPVIKINDGAFKSYDDIYAAVIPSTITTIGSNAFTEISGTKRDQVTLYYAGDPNDWKRAMDDLYVNKAYSYYTDYNTAGTYTEKAKLTLDSSWDSGAGDGSRIFFLDADGKVDPSKGYWELYRAFKKNGSGIASYGYVYIWIYHDHPYDNTLNEYNNCSNKGTHYGSFTDYDAADRPDKEYWQ